MSSTDSRALLEGRLAALLGISTDDDREYAVDVMGSLMEIGDPHDVAEYLSGFVAGGDDGNGGDDLRGFAQDLERFKRGENITVASAENAEEESEAVMEVVEAKPQARVVLDEAAAHREDIRRREEETKERQREERDLLAKKKKEEEEQKRRREEDAATAAMKKERVLLPGKEAAVKPQDVKGGKLQASSPKIAAATQSKGVQKQKSGEASTKKTALKSDQSKKAQVKAKKGKPKKKPCGCFGNKHKPLTNCLDCGRIVCEAEGINDFCHFCGYYIEDFSSKTDNDAKIASALRHKERLLKFDQESAKRTHIHDDQEDYFEASNSMWATNEEQESARQMEEQRQKKLHERQKQVLTVNF